ncbi:MAG: transcription antitermination factor NusB [Ruminococcus sp.]|nr:transcription antitermination factor NusB [Ruminococcus sp.]
MNELLGYRESAFLMLFENKFLNEDYDELFETAREIECINLGNKTRKLVWDVLHNNDHINDIIQSFSTTRAVSRIPKLNVTVLSIGIAEVLYGYNIPVKVAISEAMKLVDKYGLEGDIKFVNGVFGSFAESL